MPDPSPTPPTFHASLPSKIAKVLAAGLLVYVVGLTIYALSSYASTRSKLLTYGLSDATATFLGVSAMLVALGLPAMAVVRIAMWKPRALDYVAALLLPALYWGIAQLPAKFDAVTGEALIYCAARPDGTRFCLDRPGVDPLTQRPLEKMSSQLAEEDFRRDKDLLPRRLTTPVADIAFFDSLTGKPRVWISKNDSGCYDLFNNPGVNPQTGDRLEPVTKAIVQVVKRCAQTAALAVNPVSTKPSPQISESPRSNATQPETVARPAAPLQPTPDAAAAARDAQRAQEEAELQKIAAARAREQQERRALIEATTKGNLSEFCATLLRTCDGSECISVRTTPETACVRDCGATSWGGSECVNKACRFEIAELRSRGVIARFDWMPDRGIGPPGCVGFRPDIRGTSDGAECLRRYFGDGYYVNARLCQQDGAAYNIRLK